MKKRFFALIVLLTVFALLPNVADAGVSLRFTGGYYHMSYKDFNDWVAQENKLHDEFNAVVPPDYQVTDRYEEMHWIPEFGGEITFSVAPTVSIGVGASIISGSSSSSYFQQDFGWDISHKVRVYPFTATAYVRFPAVPIKPFLYGGAGLYRSKLTFHYYRYDPADTIDTDFDSELTDWSFGLHGGGGISFDIAPTISLDLEVRLRWADLKGYEGTATSANGDTRDVFLAKGTVGDYYFYGSPAVASKSDWDEASVNLSGYGFFIGLNIEF